MSGAGGAGRAGDVGEMVCLELVERVTEYFETVMPADDRVRFESHIAECPFCEEILEQFRALIALTGHLRTDDVVSVAPEHRDELLAAFREWSAEHP